MVLPHQHAGGHNWRSLQLVDDIFGLVEDILSMVEDVSVYAGGISAHCGLYCTVYCVL